MLTEEQEKTIRKAAASLTKILVENNHEKAKALEQMVEKHPERFSKEFLKEYYATRQK